MIRNGSAKNKWYHIIYIFPRTIENIARIAKAASHKLLGKSSLNVSFVLSRPVLSIMTMAAIRKLECWLAAKREIRLTILTVYWWCWQWWFDQKIWIFWAKSHFFVYRVVNLSRLHHKKNYLRWTCTIFILENVNNTKNIFVLLFSVCL